MKPLLFFLSILIIIIIITVMYVHMYTIKVGILFTTSNGAMATHEKRLFEIANTTIELYNKSQHKIKLQTYTYNPESSEEKYIEGAENLLSKDVALVFGCWRSVDRKNIMPIFEKYNNLLCYPLQYEGNECSKNILYFGSCPNQQINIGIEYGIKNISNKIILIGSDYVFPRTANKIMIKYIQHMNGTLLDEIYIHMEEKNFDTITNHIVSKYKDEKILIMNTMNGESNKYFFESLFNQFSHRFKDKLISEVFPVMSFSLTENDCVDYDLKYMYGNYFIWNYSQTDISYDSFLKNGYSTNSKLQNTLLQDFKKKHIIIDDPMYHTFLSILFFVNFLETYEGNYSSEDIRNKYKLFTNKKILTPTGYLSMEDNNHLQQPVYILKLNSDKRFKTIYKTPIEIHPNPWYNKYATHKYRCNNAFDFLGDKYESFNLF